jgi:hypothetical protein
MPEISDPKSKKTSDEKILEESKQRFKLCEEAERELRELALDDLKFRGGEQWPQAIKQRMIAERKPALTINVLPARERQVLNEQRQNRPTIQVSPIDDQADPDTAEVLQGIIRHIEYDSDGDVASDTAAASATRIGFGFMRLTTDYEDPKSFDQVIKIERLRNAFSVYLDPSATKADRSDAKFGYIFTTLTKEEFKQEYPNSELASLDDWKTIGDSDPDWISDDGIRIVEYFYQEEADDELLEVRHTETGQVATALASEYEKLSDAHKKVVEIGRRRPTTVPTIRWCKHSAKEILEATEWPGKYIPIIPVFGDELEIDGKLVLEGMVRHAKDPMRMQNYMASKEVQAIALAPNAPFVAAAGQIENHPEWQTANIDNHSVLTYEPVTAGGTVVEAPHRQVAEPAIQAISQARLQFADDLKAVTGIYDAQLGARSNEQSGKAILQRKTQGELSNFHFIDNLTRAQKFLGRQLIDLIPKIYSKPRVLRIIGEDGTHKTVQINQKFQQGGVEKIYDLTVGKYDVMVSAGPSYQTRRQEAVQSMLELTKAFPPIAQVTGDLLVGMMDFPNHKKLAERMRKMLPPQLQDDDDQDPAALAQKAQGQLAALSAQHEQLTAALNQANEVIKTKQVEAQSKLDIERLKVEAQITVAEITSKAQESQARMKLEQDMWLQLHSDAHELGMQKDQQGHEADQAAAAQQAQAAQQQQAQAHEADQAQQAQAAAQQQQESAQAASAGQD